MTSGGTRTRRWPATTSSPATAAWASSDRRPIRPATPACRCRSGRCIASPSISAIPTGSIQTPGRRQHAHRERSADRAGERAVVRAASPTGRCGWPRRTWRPRRRRRRTRRRAGRTGAGEHAVVRVRLHLSRAEQSSLRLGHLLRRARRDVRRDQRTAPLGQPVDAHARQRSGRPEVPLPVVAAAGDRLVRQLGLLRLPGDLPHARSRPDVGRDQSGSLDRRSEPHPLLRRRRRRQPRPVLRRGHLRDRAVADAEGRHLGRHQRRQGLDLARRRQEVDRPDQEREDAAVGPRPPHRRVALRSGHGLHGGGLSPRRQPRSVPLQDHGLRPDVDADRRRRCRRAIRSTTRSRSPRTRIARA